MSEAAPQKEGRLTRCEPTVVVWLGTNLPELPEVETVVRGLRRTLTGRRIVGVCLGKRDFMDDAAAIEAESPGQRIEGVERFGKFILLQLSKDGEEEPSSRTDGGKSYLLVHLGMTGRLVARPAGAESWKHTHVRFALDDGRELRYTDPRRFGRMALVPATRLETIVGALGADPLEASEEEFRSRFMGRPAMVKALLLDQHVLRGMGNIYADESLWRAKIHPQRRASGLDRKQVTNLRRAILHVLGEAIRHGGSSISDYVNAEGQPGFFQIRHRVYQREGKDCFRCGTRIRRVTVAGRSSFFCPHCQKTGRRNSKTDPKMSRRKSGRTS